MVIKEIEIIHSERCTAGAFLVDEQAVIVTNESNEVFTLAVVCGRCKFIPPPQWIYKRASQLTSIKKWWQPSCKTDVKVCKEKKKT